MPCRLLGPGAASRLPATTGEKQDGGRKEESRPPLATAVLNGRAASALAPTRPSPRLGSAQLKTLKIKLVFGREERARLGGQASPGSWRERCCVIVPTWTPAFCPFSLWKSRRAPEPRKAGFRVQKASQSNGNEILGWVGRFPRFFSPSISKALHFLLYLQGSDLRRAKGTSAGKLQGCPRVLGKGSLRLWGKRGRGVWTVLVPSPTHCNRLPNSSSRKPSSQSSAAPGLLNQEFLEGGKRHFTFFSF